MKKLILILSLVTCHLSLRGADAPHIEVVSLSEVRIDGVSAGQLADVMRNHPQHTSAVQVAALKWQAAHLAKVEAERVESIRIAEEAVARAVAEKDAAEKAAAGEVAKARSEKTKAEGAAIAAENKTAELLAAVDVIDADASKLPEETKAAITAARQSRAEKQRAELMALKAAIEDKLTKLPAK